MKTISSDAISRGSFFAKFAAVAGACALALGSPLAGADVQDAPAPTQSRLQGFYRVVASNDPLFTLQDKREWFMDFGKGVTSGKTHGTVAVSLRQNPKVRVKVMVWQAFPQTSTLVIGEQTGEGSNKAVALGSWQVRPNSTGFMLERGNYRIVLDRSEPGA